MAEAEYGPFDRRLREYERWRRAQRYGPGKFFGDLLSVAAPAIAGGIMGGPAGAALGGGQAAASVLGSRLGHPELGSGVGSVLAAIAQRQMMEAQQAESQRRFEQEMALRRDELGMSRERLGMERARYEAEPMREFGGAVTRALIPMGGAYSAEGVRTGAAMAGLPVPAPPEYQAEAADRDAMLSEIARERAELAEERRQGMVPEAIRARGMVPGGPAQYAPPTYPAGDVSPGLPGFGAPQRPVSFAPSVTGPQALGRTRAMFEAQPPPEFGRTAPAQEQLEPTGEPPWSAARQVGYAAEQLGGLPTREEEQARLARERGLSLDEQLSLIKAKGEQARATAGVRGAEERRTVGVRGEETRTTEAARHANRLDEIKARYAEISQIRQTPGYGELDAKTKARIAAETTRLNGAIRTKAASLDALPDAAFDAYMGRIDELINQAQVVTRGGGTTETRRASVMAPMTMADATKKYWELVASAQAAGEKYPSLDEFLTRLRGQGRLRD